MRWINSLKIGKLNINLKLLAWYKGSARTGGYSARVLPTCLFINFLDYDNITDERLIEELQFLQEWFHLGNFYVFFTSDLGRHCVCLDAFPLKAQIEIVEFSSCDQAFKRAPGINEHRTWVLRYDKKGDRDASKVMVFQRYT